MAFEAGDYGRDDDETLAAARERSGRAAGVGSGGNGGGAWGWDRWMGRALAAVYGTYSSGGKTSIIGNIGRGSAGLHAAAAREDG